MDCDVEYATHKKADNQLVAINYHRVNEIQVHLKDKSPKIIET